MNTGVLVVPDSDLDQFIIALQELLKEINYNDKIVAIFSRDSQKGTFAPQIVLAPLILGSAERCERLLKPFAQIASFKAISTVPDQYAQSHALDSLFATAPKRVYYAGSGLGDLSEPNVFDVQLFKDIWKRWKQWTGEHELGRESVVMWAYSRAGAIETASNGETAFNKRNSANFVILQGRTRTSLFDKEIETWTQEVADYVRQKQPDGGVLTNLSYGTETVEEVFGEDMAKRLRSIKKKYDPDNVWTKGYRFQ